MWNTAHPHDSPRFGREGMALWVEAGASSGTPFAPADARFQVEGWPLARGGGTVVVALAATAAHAG